VDGLKRIKAMPNIIVAEMVNNYFENDKEIVTHIPPKLEVPSLKLCAAEASP